MLIVLDFNKILLVLMQILICYNIYCGHFLRFVGPTFYRSLEPHLEISVSKAHLPHYQ